MNLSAFRWILDAQTLQTRPEDSQSEAKTAKMTQKSNAVFQAALGGRTEEQEAALEAATKASSDAIVAHWLRPT